MKSIGNFRNPKMAKVKTLKGRKCVPEMEHKMENRFLPVPGISGIMNATYRRYDSEYSKTGHGDDGDEMMYRGFGRF